jgi:enoyl-CoA hydratase
LDNSYQHLTVELAETGVATVTFNRPPANAVDQVMYREIASLFGNVDGIGPDVRAIVLAASGRHFCAGNDLDEFATMTPENGTERMWRVREAFFAISGCAVPVIGAVHGAALGTGLAIAASCDFLVAEREARFGLPEMTVGVMGGARHLARMAPQAVVRRMFFTGEPLTAEQLLSAGAGLIVCDRADLLPEARRLAERIASYSSTAVRAGKRVLDRIETMDLYSGYIFEQAATVRMSGHPDSKEALTAFREKRPPRYDPRIDRTRFD